jgi:hypothetical protein
MNQSYYDEEYPETNRDKVLAPQKKFFYCICDMDAVRPWKKCSVCNRRNGRKRLKN